MSRHRDPRTREWVQDEPWHDDSRSQTDANRFTFGSGEWHTRGRVEDPEERRYERPSDRMEAVA